MRMLWKVVLAVCCLFVVAPVSAADNPYSPAMTVNEGVITRYDIDQRGALLSALGATGDLRELAIQQLTEDRLKIQAGRAMGIVLPDGSIETGLEEFATNRGLTLDDVLTVLEARNIDRQTMDDFVESGLIWRQVVVTRFRARATPTDEDLDQALELNARMPREMVQVGEIALPFAERGEPETLALADRLYRELSAGANFSAVAREFSRSASAEQGGALDPMPANQMPPDLRSQILLMRQGQVTRPMPISGGVAILKLLSVKQVPPTGVVTEVDAEQRDALRQQMFSERINSFGQGFLQEMVSDALIVQR